MYWTLFANAESVCVNPDTLSAQTTQFSKTPSVRWTLTDRWRGNVLLYAAGQELRYKHSHIDMFMLLFSLAKLTKTSVIYDAFIS